MVQAVSTQTQAQSAATFGAAPVNITGRVVNAATGLPIPRALVRYNSQPVLTDHEGRFQFSIPTDTSGRPLSGLSIYFDVSKPGFFNAPDPWQGGATPVLLSQLAGPIELRLYPEAILTGTAIAPNGEPLAHLGITARREAFNEAARGYRWTTVGQTQTNLRGEFRIPVPAGDYRLETRYSPRNDGMSFGIPADFQTGSQEAVMPLTLPTPDSSVSAHQAIHMLNGQEQHFDLRPAIRRTYLVPISIESSNERGYPVVIVHASNETTFNIGVAPNRGTAGAGRNSTPGSEFNRTGSIYLPTGTYTLSARTQDQEGVQTAETSVTVTGNPATDSGAVLRFAATPSISVELIIDPTATSDNSVAPRTSGTSARQTTPATNTPNLQQLGLSLQRVDSTSDQDQSYIGLTVPRNAPPVFKAPPGTYRLVANALGLWHIRSASYGSSELLGQTLVVAAGSAGSAIRLTVTNLGGGVTGTVRLNGAPVSAWVYLISTAPSASPIVTFQSDGSTGQIQYPYLLPGTYQAIAFERHHPADYTDPAALQPFSSYVQNVTITAGGQAQLNLNAVPQSFFDPGTKP